MTRAEIEQSGHPIPQPNQIHEIAKGILNSEIKDLSQGDIRGVASLVAMAFQSEDYETLKYISDMAQRMQSTAFIKDPIQRATIKGIGAVATEGTWIYRPTPQLDEAQVDLMKKIADGKLESLDGIDLEILNFLYDHGLIAQILTARDKHIVSCGITPFGIRALESIVG